jgi:hypothetical protein
LWPNRPIAVAPSSAFHTMFTRPEMPSPSASSGSASASSVSSETASSSPSPNTAGACRYDVVTSGPRNEPSGRRMLITGARRLNASPSPYASVCSTQLCVTITSGTPKVAWSCSCSPSSGTGTSPPGTSGVPSARLTRISACERIAPLPICDSPRPSRS